MESDQPIAATLFADGPSGAHSRRPPNRSPAPGWCHIGGASSEGQGSRRIGRAPGGGGAFEAANDRSSTPLERRLLGQLAQSVDSTARRGNDTGVGWVAAAIVEAVESGDRFVAPRRVGEISRRWARDGGPCHVASGHDQAAAPAIGRPTRTRSARSSSPGGSDPADDPRVPSSGGHYAGPG